MLKWNIILAITAVAVLFSLLILFLLRRCLKTDRPPSKPSASAGVFPAEIESFGAKIAKLQQSSLGASDIKRSGNANSYYVLRRPSSGAGVGLSVNRGLFSWSDHPNLINDAFENGWSRFGFVSHVSLGESNTEIAWEVSNGYAESMQKIKFNRGFQNLINSNHFSTIRTALPLPGPQLGNSAFPQEAYFEVTILRIIDVAGDGDDVAHAEGEKTKLINERFGYVNNKEVKIVKSNKDYDGKVKDVSLCLGLTANLNSVSDHTKPPGRFHGSIGFNSDGSIFLDGLKLAFESEKHEWVKRDKVIGCGFDPRKKNVFFTVNSHLVHVIKCKSEEFETPLYPTIASNTEATVLVNLGQSPFAYGPANGRRTANPCFVGSLVRSSPAATFAGFEDSGELFSMGRIDSQYLNRFINHGNADDDDSCDSSGRLGRKPEEDDQSDADLFEIVLEGSGRLPNTRF